GRAAHPTAPEVDGVLERPGYVVGSAGRRLPTRLHLLEYEGRRLVGAKGELRHRRPVHDAHRDRGPEEEGERGPTPGDEAHPVGGLLGGMSRPRVVEARLAHHPEADLAADRLRAPDDVVRLPTVADRHEVRYLGHAIVGEKARQENTGVGQVELFLARALEEGG